MFRKISHWIFTFSALGVFALVLLTAYGPWHTYYVPGNLSGFGQDVGVGSLPVWLGECMRYTHGAYTPEDSAARDKKWLENHPEEQEFYEIGRNGFLQSKGHDAWVDEMIRKGIIKVDTKIDALEEDN